MREGVTIGKDRIFMILDVKLFLAMIRTKIELTRGDNKGHWSLPRWWGWKDGSVVYRVLGDLAEKFGSQHPHRVVQTAYNSRGFGFCRHLHPCVHTETQAYIRDVEVTKASPRLEKLRQEAKIETACR